MASTYSTNLGLELIGNGEQAGTWGATTNNNWGDIIERAATGYLSLTVADSAVSPTSLTIPNGIVAGQGNGRYLYYVLTGTLTAPRDLIIPNKNKIYYFYNNTTGGFAVTVKVSGQTGVSIANGKKYVLVCNGIDAIDALPIDMTRASNTLPVGNGGTGATSLSAANIAVTNVSNTFTAVQNFTGTASAGAALFNSAQETTTVTATALTGTVAVNFNAGLVVFYNAAAQSADWTWNFRWSATPTTLNAVLLNNQTITVALMVNQGATAYKMTALQIDGTAVTPKWQGGAAPSSGNTSSIDVYTFVITKTAANTYTVLGSFTKFA